MPCFFLEPFFIYKCEMLIWVYAESALSFIAMKMELKDSTILTFLLLFFLATPCFSRGGSDVVGTEVYEIDYRGPETHSSIPPPDHSHGKPLIHKESAMASPKPKSSRASSMGRKKKR
ncbi:hypothetical protein Prudu_017571 [Prunus dulcis]|uniref:Uncharacterized protein n=1 Tax=Prunus dulcis TaxID=3755 RepID=A0A4Y1RPJ4_PRUDU|nr:hypothetical protein Prudu_017571 [Prunus dulcis]